MSWNLFAKLARMLALPVSYIVVIRFLGEYNWGVLNVLKTIKSFALVLIMLGGGKAVLRYVPVIKIQGGMQSLVGTFKKMLLLQFLVWAVLLVAAWYLAPRFSTFYNLEAKPFNLYLTLALAFALFEVSMMMVTNILQSWYETRIFGVVMLLGNICYLLLLILILKAGGGILGYFAAGALVNLSMTLALVPKIVSLVRSSPADRIKAPELKRILAYSLPFVVTGFLNQVVWRHSEVLFLGRFSGMAAAGYFGLAYDIPQMALEFVPLTIWPIVMAGTSEVYTRNKENLTAAIDIYYRLLYILVMPIAALGFAFTRPLISIFLANEMAAAAVPAQMFFVVFSYSFLYTPLSMALYVMEKSWVNMLVFAALAVVNIGLDIALIPRYGIWGAFFPVALTFILGIVFFRAVLGRFRPDIRIPVIFVAKCYLAALPAALLALISARYYSLGALALELILGIALLWAGFRYLKIIGENEKKMIMKLPIPLKEKLISIF